MKNRTTELYRHFDADGKLLYIGISVSSSHRFGSHSSSSHWADLVTRIEIERFPNRAEAMAAEMAAIDAESPLHNVRTPKRKGLAARDPIKEAARQELIAEATQRGIRINRVWCISSLQNALKRAPMGVPYPYNGLSEFSQKLNDRSDVIRQIVSPSR